MGIRMELITSDKTAAAASLQDFFNMNERL